MKFDYFGAGAGNGTAIGTFSVLWSSENYRGGHKLDSLEGINVFIYKCEQLASNCGLCLALDEKKFNCGWCMAEQQCSERERCISDLSSDWVDRFVDYFTLKKINEWY